jgi:parallel beta-helix repeat protein
MAQARNFGAKGDGVNDDTQALQHAVDMGDGVLELGKGTFRITRPIILDMTKHGYLGVRGDHGTATIRMDGPGPALKIVGDHQGTATPGSFKPSTWAGERMPIITGIEILGNHDEADGIQLFRTVQTTIQAVLIRKCRYGIHLVERNRNLLVSAAHVYDCHDTGIFFDDCNLHQVIITGSHISYCKRAGIRQLNGDVHNIQITGNDIEYNSGAEGTSGEIVLEAPEAIISEYTISGNTIQATRLATGANVLIIGKEDILPAHVRLINITGNVLGSRQESIAISHASKVCITGNTIYSGDKSNIRIDNCQNVVIGSNVIGTRPTTYKVVSLDGVIINRSKSCAITGNVLTDCGTPGAVTIVNSSDIGVSSNQIENAQHTGVLVVDSTRCRLSDNSIVDSRDAKQMDFAIRVTEKSRSILVQNNATSPGTKGTVECSAESGKTVENTTWE